MCTMEKETETNAVIGAVLALPAAEELDNQPSSTSSSAARIRTKESAPATKINEPEITPEYVQRKLYFLIDQLKEMHGQLPE